MRMRPRRIPTVPPNKDIYYNYFQVGIDTEQYTLLGKHGSSIYGIDYKFE